MEVNIHIKIEPKEIGKSIYQVLVNYGEGLLSTLKNKDMWYGIFFSILIHFLVITIVFEEPPMIEKIKEELIMVDVLDESYKTSAIATISKQKLYTTVLPTKIEELHEIRSSIARREEATIYARIQYTGRRRRRGYATLVSDLEVLAKRVKENVKDTVVMSKDDIKVLAPMFTRSLAYIRDQMDHLALEIIRIKFFIVISVSGEVINIQKLQGSQNIKWDNLVQEAIVKSAFRASPNRKIRRGILEVILYREGEYVVKLNGEKLRTGLLTLLLPLPLPRPFQV